MSMKIKVNTARLRDSVESRKTKLVAKHAKDVASYETKVSKLRPKLADELRAYADKVESGDVQEMPAISETYGAREKREHVVEIPTKLRLPKKPHLDTRTLDGLLRTLGVADDQEITLEPSEANYYLDDTGDLG